MSSHSRTGNSHRVAHKGIGWKTRASTPHGRKHVNRGSQRGKRSGSPRF